MVTIRVGVLQLTLYKFQVGVNTPFAPPSPPPPLPPPPNKALYFECKVWCTPMFLFSCSGPAFIPYLEGLPSMSREDTGPFRMPIADKYKVHSLLQSSNVTADFTGINSRLKIFDHGTALETACLALKVCGYPIVSLLTTLYYWLHTVHMLFMWQSWIGITPFTCFDHITMFEVQYSWTCVNRLCMRSNGLQLTSNAEID